MQVKNLEAAEISQIAEAIPERGQAGAERIQGIQEKLRSRAAEERRPAAA